MRSPVLTVSSLAAPVVRAIACLALLACGDDGDDEPAAPDRGTSESTGVGTTGNDASTSSSTSSGGAVFTATAMTADDGTTTTDVPGAPMLVFPGGTRVDFGPRALDDGQIQALEVLNLGLAAAENLEPATRAPEGFSYTGGRYPGNLGNCGASLDAMEICIVHVEFAPTGLGAHGGALTLDYAGPDGPQQVSVELLGTGVGSTDNLVDDGGFEACRADTAPPAWTQPQGEHWRCAAMAGGRAPARGASVLTTPDPSSGPVSLATSVDLAAHTLAIETGEVSASASLSTLLTSADTVELFIRYLDADGKTVAEATPETLVSPTWTPSSDERVLPSTARSAVIELACAAGSVACAVSLDAAALNLTFDP